MCVIWSQRGTKKKVKAVIEGVDQPRPQRKGKRHGCVGKNDISEGVKMMGVQEEGRLSDITRRFAF